jgi:hypothetical protein
MADKRFWEYIDKPMSTIAIIVDIWAAKRKNRDIHNKKLKRKIPSGWSTGESGSASN